MKRTIPIIIASMMLLAGCEKVIDIDPQQVDPLVVVYSDVQADSGVAVRLTLSRFFLSTRPFQEIVDAGVTLSVNGGAEISPAVQQGGVYRFGYTPAEGDVVVLRANVPGKGVATAQTVVPKAASVHSIRVTKLAAGDGEKHYQLRFTLEDDGSQEDYYLIRIREKWTYYDIYEQNGEMVTDTIHHSYNQYFACSDYELTGQGGALDILDDDEYPYNQLLFDDATLNGQSREVALTMSFDGYDVWGDQRELYLDVYTVSRDRYLYEKSLVAYDDDLGLFSEPVQIHTNIKGGIGLFASRTLRTFKINME